MSAADFPRAVLFDHDGTLVDTEPLWETGKQRIVAAHGGEWTDRDTWDTLGEPLAATVQRLSELGVPGSPEEVFHAPFIERQVERGAMLTLALECTVGREDVADRLDVTRVGALGVALRERLGGHDLSQVRAFALDEYVGLDPAHPESYRSVITREVVEPLGLDPDLVRVPSGAIETIQHAGEDYEQAIEAAGAS